METKTCSKCGCQKPVNEFPIKENRCRQCKSEYQRKWYKEHSEQVKAYNVKWKKENHEHILEYNKEYAAKWRKEHPEQCKESVDKWRKEHPEQRREYAIEWSKEHPEYFRKHSREYSQTPQGKQCAKNYVHNRRAKIKGQKITLEEWTVIKQQQKYRCYWSRTHSRKKIFKDKELTMDHVRPLKRGGLHEASNIVASCQPCNSSKGTKLWSLV